ncbi:MAG: SHOCT domain-containing protein [Phycisphaeraceae bacterium]|nr:SHOCT domain-containing protein [Phycisphaeraceae bacterium]
MGACLTTLHSILTPAQAGVDRGMPTGVLLVLVGGMIVLAIIGGVVVMVVRNRLLAKSDSRAESGSMLDSLRRARDRGEISPDEFDAARSALIARTSFGEGVTKRPVTRKPWQPASTPADEPRSRVAPPGFDLTGAPLPPTPPEGPGTE